MATNGGSQYDRLREAGIIRDDLPDAYADVVDGLTPDEVDLLVAVKKRLDSADERFLGRPMEPDEEPHFRVYIQF